MSEYQWHDEAKKQWDERATFWHANSKEMWETGSRKTIIPFLSKYVSKGSAVIDVGCGDGYGSYKLWKEGYKVTGVDLSEEMITLCNERKTDEMKDLSFQQGDMLHLPYNDEGFDSLMAINSLEWTENPAVALTELNRVVKKSGFLCLGILGPTAGPRANSYPRLYGEKVIMNTMMPWEFSQLAEENGLRVVDGEGVYKKGVDPNKLGSLSKELQQALTFMWLFILQK